MLSVWTSSIIGLALAGPTISSRPLIQTLSDADGKFEDVYSIAIDKRKVVHLGRRGEIVAWDGNKPASLKVPTADRVRGLELEGDRLWYAGDRDVGFVDLSDRARAEPVSLKACAKLSDEPFKHIFGTAEEISFGASDGTLLRCQRPVDVRCDCSKSQPPKEGYTVYSRVDGSLWAHVWGSGLYRAREGEGYDLVATEGEFAEDRLVVHLPGRRTGERLLGFVRAGLFWWRPGEPLESVELPGEPNELIFTGLELRDGRYAVGTLEGDLLIFDGEGAYERLDLGKDLSAILTLNQDEDGLLWAAGPALINIVVDRAIRAFSLDETWVQGIESTEEGTYVLTHTRLMAVQDDGSPAGRLEEIAPFGFAQALEVVDGRVFVGDIEGIHQIVDGRAQLLIQEPDIREIHWDPLRPELLAVSTVWKLQVYERSAAGLRKVFELDSERTGQLTRVDEHELWFLSLRGEIRRLSDRGGAWSEGSVHRPRGENAGASFLLRRGRGEVWAPLGSSGLHRFDEESGAFVPDERLRERLGLTPELYSEATLTISSSSPQLMTVSALGSKRGVSDFWIGRRRAFQAPHEADWKTYPAWYLDRIALYQHARAVADERLLFGGVGQLVSVQPSLSGPPQAPARPFFRELRAWSVTSTASLRLPDRPAPLPFEMRSVEMRFASPEHHPRSQLSFRTRIPELGPMWSSWSSSTERIFENLPIGPVTLEVQAKDEVNRTSEVLSVGLVVEPPFYWSRPMVVTYGFLGLIVGGLVLRTSNRGLRRRAERLRQELLERTKSEALARGQTQLLGRAMASLSQREGLNRYLQEILAALVDELSARSIILWTEEDGELVERFREPASDEECLPPRLRTELEVEGETLWIPMAVEDRSVGLLQIELGAQDPPDEAKLFVANALAGQATLALEFSRLEEFEMESARMAERSSLAREVHDSLAQHFALTGLKLDELLLRRHRAGSEDQEWAQGLRAVREVNRTGLAEARHMIRLLRGDGRAIHVLTDLLADLRTRAEAFGLSFSLEHAELSIDPDPRVAFELYRISQEALANIIKHADATKVAIQVWSRQSELVLQICDDGRGMKVDGFEGFGIRSMHERAAAIGARCVLDSSPGEGVCVKVTWSHDEELRDSK